MAYRKVDETSLTAVADAIRAKGGTSGQLEFPDGFVSAVEAIQSGGGEDDSSFREVIERTAANPTLPSDLTKIGDFAFYNYTNFALTSLPAGITSIGSYAFYNCKNLALTSLPAGIKSIDSYAFYGCRKLALTSIPAGITSIVSYAFSNCADLTTITFEGTPSSINSTAFSNCTKLTTINVPWAEGAVANAPWGAKNATINYNYTGE